MNGATSTRRYRLVFAAYSRVILETPLSLDSPGALSAVVKTVYATNEHGTVVSGPLSMVVESAAEDITNAEVRARGLTETLASLLALLGRAPVGQPELLLAYQAGPDTEPRPFHEFVYPQEEEDLRPRRRVAVERLIALLAGLDAVDAAARDRMLRALRAHRRALDEEDPVDRALLVAIALEALNPLLARHLGANDYRIENCANCGREQRQPTAGGVDAWLTRTSGSDISREHRRLRNGYVHGFGDLPQLSETAQRIGLAVEASLVAAVLELTGVTDTAIPRQPMGPRIPYVVQVAGELTGPVEAGIAAGAAHPHVTVQTEIVGSRNVEDDAGIVSAEYTVSTNYQMVLPPGVELTPRFIIPHDPEAVYGESTMQYIPAARVRKGEEATE